MTANTKIFESSDKNVKKFVFDFGDAVAEAVLYKYNSYEERTVICCSVSSGCGVGCTFCGTGKFFVRHLTADEIVEQVVTCVNHTGAYPDKIKKFQIMFMSMGEPMHNYIALEKAITSLAEKYKTAALLVSTSAPKSIYQYIDRFIMLSKRISRIGLQFSVHESTDEARKTLIPTKTCTLKEISEIGEDWAESTGRKPFYNYCVHTGNDTEADAERLIELFNPDVWETTLSVICNKDETVANSIDRQLETINAFAQMLLDRGASLRVFNPAGQDDIGGGCGQLWYFQEWLKKHKEKINKTENNE